MSSWETMPEHVLESIVHGLKKGMMRVIDMDAETRTTSKDEKSCPPEASFQFNFLLLQRAEKEIMRRGFDPSDSRWGQDIMSDIAEVQVEVMQGLR